MLTPDEIASRQFLVSLRGYDRDEVDRFLEQVADTVAGLQRRLRELEDELEAEPSRAQAARDAAPAVPATVSADSPQQAFKALGEETTRILVAAEESARAIKQKAEERAQQEVETARREARDEVESARRTASKVVADAERRRNQVAEDVRGLESLRDRLADQLREVVRTTTGAMRGLAPASTESRSDDELPAVGGGGPSQPERETRPPGSAPAPGGASSPQATPVSGPTPSARSESERAPASEPLSATGAAVATPVEDDDLDGAEDLWDTATPDEALAPDRSGPQPRRTHVFDAMGEESDEEPPTPEPPTEAAPEPEAALAEEPSPEPDVAHEVEVESGAAPEAADTEEPAESGDEDELTPAGATVGSRQLREQSLAAVRPGLLRKVKRALQDVQNEVLDSLRRAGDDPALDDVLPNEEGLTVLGAVGEQFLSQAYEAGLTDGAELAGELLPGDAADPARVPARSATFGAVISHEVTAALRATLRAGIEAGETSTSLSERVGEIFRDLKGPVAEVTVDEHLSRTYGYGTLDAWQALGHTAKEWVPGIAPRCPEEMRAQNADAGAVDLGAEFPTGQVVPPAHDGCDCTLVPR